MTASLKPEIERLESYGLTSDFQYIEKGRGLHVLQLPPKGFDFNLLEGYTGNNDQIHEDNDKRNTLANVVNWITNHHNLLSS